MIKKDFYREKTGKQDNEVIENDRNEKWEKQD